MIDGVSKDPDDFQPEGQAGRGQQDEGHCVQGRGGWVSWVKNAAGNTWPHCQQHWGQAAHYGGQQDEQHRAQVVAGKVSWVADSCGSEEWRLDEDDWDQGDIDDNGVNVYEVESGVK